MQNGRFVKILNLSIAVLLLLIAAAIYWFVYRPLPQTSGKLIAPISQPARILRDARGAPHVETSSVDDAIFLQGFVTAQDRMWQMDALRRLAAGELSEIIGSATLNADLQARSLGMRRIAEQSYQTMPAADRILFDAYARGVNYYIETSRHRLPVEFHLLHYQPKPWAGVDSVLCALEMFRTLTDSSRDDLQKYIMLQGGDAKKVDFLFPSRSGREAQPGSNAWAISGTHTASGKPILANDPHLDYTVPATWYMIHLKAPALDTIGVSLPGVPAVIIGHNPQIAWGVTNLGFDVQDLYIEKLNPKTGEYMFRGKLEQARREAQRILVKDSKPVEYSQWITRHGPVLTLKSGTSLALRWTAAEPGLFRFPFLEIDQARNWQEFSAALSRFSGPGQNLVYADTTGNIGYHATGRLPIRRGFEGDLPVDGSSGNYEWNGYIPFDELPAFFNPPSGVIVTANQNPFPPDYKYGAHGVYATQYRSNQIRALLTAHDGWKPEGMLAVQRDVYSAFSHFLAQQLAEAYDLKKPHDTDLAEAAKILRVWNGQMEIGLSAPMITALVYQRLKVALAETASPHKGAIYDFEMAPMVVQAVLESGAKGWFPDKDEALLKLLKAAIGDGRKLQGGNPSHWDYGRFHALTIRNPVDGQIPMVGRYFNIGPVPMSGSPSTIKQVSGQLGPSMRFVADLSDWDNSLNNITVGESGHILSAHYKDEWDAYYYARSFPMQFSQITAEQILEIMPAK